MEHRGYRVLKLIGRGASGDANLVEGVADTAGGKGVGGTVGLQGPCLPQRPQRLWLSRSVPSRLRRPEALSFAWVQQKKTKKI